MKAPRLLPSILRTFVAVLAWQLPAVCRGDFSGEDSLATNSDKWAEFPSHNNKDRFRFQNSRLEHVKSGRALLFWTPNRGTINQSWFIQVDVRSENDQANLGVFKGGDHDKGYVIGMNTHGFGTGTYKGYKSQYSVSSLHRATLRMHFDHKAKTLTSSWKTRGAWSYFDPEDIDDWHMTADGKFIAILVGGTIKDASDKDDDYPPYYSSSGGDSSWEVYFTHFKCGDAAPDIGVEQPAYNDLQDGVSKKSFGTAAVGGSGVSRGFTIRNNGTASLGKLSILKDGIHAPEFRVSEISKPELKPGESTTFTVTFKPKSKGTREAAIHIRSNAPDKSPFDISLAGQGAGG